MYGNHNDLASIGRGTPLHGVESETHFSLQDTIQDCVYNLPDCLVALNEAYDYNKLSFVTVLSEYGACIK